MVGDVIFLSSMFINFCVFHYLMTFCCLLNKFLGLIFCSLIYFVALSILLICLSFVILKIYLYYYSQKIYLLLIYNCLLLPNVINTSYPSSFKIHSIYSLNVNLCFLSFSITVYTLFCTLIFYFKNCTQMTS